MNKKASAIIKDGIVGMEKGAMNKVVLPLVHEFKFKDIMQVIVGASILAIPVGFTEETWKLGQTLPLSNIIGLTLLSLVFISAFTFYHYYRYTFKQHHKQFVKRVLSTYISSFIVVAILLTLIQRAPWSSDWLLALKRIIIVAFPASMSAAVADTIK